MNKDIQIIPAILAISEEEYCNKLAKIEKNGAFEGGWVQIDLMDNKFVQNQSISADIVAKYPTKLKKEAHLMVEYPENWIDSLVRAGVERIIFPVEDGSGIEERVKHIKDHGIEVGLALNPETPIAKVEPFVAKIETVLIMSVHPGFEGQKFLPEVLEKIGQAVRLRQETGTSFLIEVDGGINERNVWEVAEAGADILVIGSHLIDGNITENLEKIWQALKA
ncbi:MAG: ribulose-phosphate 3-epimerase [Patescibacteria group bacterium]|nr:ribulose-phosphate 3-epimerase [Patescibacteria group bacterium]